VGDRQETVKELARFIAGENLGHPTRVAVDGVTASGKSTLARELAAAVESTGRPVIHLTMDGFHHPRERRWRQGRTSAAGYYEDAYDFEIVELWDQRVFVDTELSVARDRGTRRDTALLGGLEEARRIYDERYHAAARRYLAEVDPARRATVVVENNDLAQPRLSWAK
jgi:uridine kinase